MHLTESKETSSKCFFCPTSSPKPTDSSLTIISDKEKHAILTFKKLEAANVWHFVLKNDDWKNQSDYQIRLGLIVEAKL